MAAEIPIFMRPIEIHDGNDSYSYKLGAAAAVPLALTNGVYATVATVLSSMINQINNDMLNTDLTAEFVAASDTDLTGFYIHFENANAADIVITWTDTDLRDMLGFTGVSTTIPAGSDEVASVRPEYLWIPTFAPSDQGVFYSKQREIFSGNIGQTGRLAGNTTGPTILYRDYTFMHELAANVFWRNAVVSTDWTRCLEHFSRESRESYPIETTNPSTKGFYLWEDIDTLRDTNVGDSWEITDTGDMILDLVGIKGMSYIFCHIDTPGIPLPVASLPASVLRFNCNLSIHTAVAPDDGGSWQFVAAV